MENKVIVCVSKFKASSTECELTELDKYLSGGEWSVKSIDSNICNSDLGYPHSRIFVVHTIVLEKVYK